MSQQSVSYHIFQQEIVAQNYDKNFIRAFDQKKFEELIPQILTDHCSNEWEKVRVFEGGVGSGLFTIPMSQYVLQRDARSFLVGKDNSKAMLQVLFDKPEFQALQNQSEGRVSVGYGDLEEEADYPKSDFNVLVFAGVLHCLDNVRFFLKQINRVLEKNGILILVFKIDAFTRLQCGEPISYSSIDTDYGNFWKHYHFLRRSYDMPLDRRCRFIYDVYLVNKLLQIQFNRRYILQRMYEFSWSSQAPFEKMIRSIEDGLNFATGQGVRPGMRKKLGERMRGWLLSNHLENKEVEINHEMELAVWKKTA